MNGFEPTEDPDGEESQPDGRFALIAQDNFCDDCQETEEQAAKIRELEKRLLAAHDKAAAYERDWYAAKSQFGDAMARSREKIRELEATVAAQAPVVEAAKDHAQKERNSTYAWESKKAAAYALFAAVDALEKKP